MSFKGGPAMVANGYIFSCNNANWGFKSRHYTCEDHSYPVRLNTERWDLVQTIKGEHTCIMPNTIIACLLKWYLVQIMPTSKDLFPTQLAMLACKHLSSTNLKRVPTHNKLVKFVSDRRQALTPLTKSATTIKELILTNALKKTENGEMFLLHDNRQEVEDRITAYATTQNLEQLNTATVMVDSIMLSIVCLNKKAWKARKPVSKLTKLTDYQTKRLIKNGSWLLQSAS
ncbi:hypothetical protein DSO57_1025836 [Entomophthora muscae]|uniref:Uncharacterized protein n=1 Tax=Entomophthora muscae TaxID=34485 RepID=A0ACC2RH73_9FUNG|nr:hypothetical protein DSO57_1025836 [Entomophthora muscae]